MILANGLGASEAVRLIQTQIHGRQHKATKPYTWRCVERVGSAHIHMHTGIHTRRKIRVPESFRSQDPNQASRQQTLSTRAPTFTSARIRMTVISIARARGRTLSTDMSHLAEKIPSSTANDEIPFNNTRNTTSHETYEFIH